MCEFGDVGVTECGQSMLVVLLRRVLQGLPRKFVTGQMLALAAVLADSMGVRGGVM
jgi:hypothetical protein